MKEKRKKKSRRDSVQNVLLTPELVTFLASAIVSFILLSGILSLKVITVMGLIPNQRNISNKYYF